MKQAILFFTLIELASAQAPTGTIAGTVTDPAGAAIAGAHVHTSPMDKGLEQEQAS